MELKQILEEIIIKYINYERETENLPPLTMDELDLFIKYNYQRIELALYDLSKLLQDETYIINKNIYVELPPRINDDNWLIEFIKEYM